MSDLDSLAARLDALTVLDATSHQMEARAAPFVALPPGYTAHDLSALLPRPVRVKAERAFRDTRSLAEYLNRFWRPEMVAYSNPDLGRIDVIIDHLDHADEGSIARHESHRASFVARHTSAYAAWLKIDGQPMSQVKAGEFLEDRATDVIEPDSATIMDMVMSFDALKQVAFKQSSRLRDGTVQLTYVESSDVRGAVTLPERIVLLVPVYEGHEPERVVVRVRYRFPEGKLAFRFEIADREALEEKAFARCEDALVAGVGKGVLLLRAT
ncbi:MAG TPA: DUF2303 family protein [Amaricoccus sp.]|uniref:DUF2303 family protein n=1 Tax=Amaricoccus sp. TaxID=1872485 RepID=UPI002C4DD707|nr:DUF2303 family protein [Amaricoccus sp.]HMR51216.1 DUF2303 family protein [Amaricoccus sp.]HMT98035.1 DUF2303 family protein [Amaricoccus sp.]